MHQFLPRKIKNHLGEELVFHRREMEGGEEKLIIEMYLAPGTPPTRHVYLQDEYFVVLHGKLGYRVNDEAPRYAGVGETVLFKKGTPHSFWNAGHDELNCFGWICPANNVVGYLTALFDSINRNKADKPGQFDKAYLLYHYRNEFDDPEVPRLVKSLFVPAAYGIGKLMGKYRQPKTEEEAKPG